jgi:Protein of unknown function (DUF2971)
MDRNPDILYHYCSNLAFYSIITQRKIRLSLLSMSNDAKEGQHILDLANAVLPDDFSHKKDALEQLQTVLSAISALGFCLSAASDVLSQWRGYADNAQGVAIGFDFAALKAATEAETKGGIVVRLAPIGYEDKMLAQVIGPDLEPVIDHYKAGKMTWRSPSILMTDEEREHEGERYRQAFSDLFHMLHRIANYAYMIKAPFFGCDGETASP